jgi:hypothetical protein
MILQRLTTEHTEKILSKAVICQPLARSYFVPPLCVLSIIIIFSCFNFYYGKSYLLSLCPALQKSSAPIPCYAIKQDTILGLFPLIVILLENTENPSVFPNAFGTVVSCCSLILITS